MSTLCVVGSTFTFSVAVEDQGNAGLWKGSPTIAAGDFQRSINGAAFANLDNLPTVTPAAGRRIQIVLSAAETTSAAAGGVITVVGVDAAGDEWYDVCAEVRVSARDIDDLAYPNTSGRGIDVDANGGVEVGALQSAVITAAAMATDCITSDELAASATAEIAAAAWAYVTRTLTQSAAAVAAAVAGSVITIHRGDSLSASITGLGDISGRSKLWFTIKAQRSLVDAAAVVQIEESAGLVYLDGADASARSANGSITVTDAVAGDITIALDEVETDDLDVATGLYYDIQVLTSGGAVSTLSSGSAAVTADVTRAVS